MNDSLKQNRDLRKRRRSLKEIYRDETVKASGQYDINEIRERVKIQFSNQKRRWVMSRIRAVLVLLLLSSIIFLSHRLYKRTAENPPPKKVYFNTIFHDVGKSEQLKVDFYPLGGKAAETRYKNGLKHQNSESYYPTGQQFRSALYYFDTLVIDLYLFKNGDTIRNFPKVGFDSIYPIEIMKNDSIKVRFDYLDGKIILDSYWEEIID